MLSSFLSPTPSLKICGVTTPEDALHLAKLKVHALGLNFWPPSKRYCTPENASQISPQIEKDILRVGVFVNNSRPLAFDLFQKNIIDVVQLHGDETLADITYFLDRSIPVIHAVSATRLPTYPLPKDNFALLIDTPAGKHYGGTGKTFDWSIASAFQKKHPNTPIILAGGLTPSNATTALQTVHPAALDIASGAELSPGIKDFNKIKSLLSTLSLKH